MLPSATAQWMTPMVPNGGRAVSAEVVASKGKSEAGKRTVGLESQVRHVWASPTAHDGRRPGADLRSTQNTNLNRDAANWPTPASRDQKGENSMAHLLRTDGRTDGRIHHIDQLPNFVMFHFSRQDLTMTDGQTLSPPDQTLPQQRLNPNFVDWLMGWPPGWTSTEQTACGAEEMASWRSKLDWHLSSLLGEPELHRRTT